MEDEKIRERRRKGRIVCKQENVILSMNKSLGGVGDPWLGTKDSNLNIFFFLMCEDLI
jgi:hypothetical protein